MSANAGMCKTKNHWTQYLVLCSYILLSICSPCLIIKWFSVL